MRSLTGYSFIAFLLPAFLLLLYFTDEEASKAKSFQQQMDSIINDKDINLSITSVMLDHNGQVFSELNKPYRSFAPSEEIPIFLKDLLIYSEDQNFYEHIGFDAGAILRALVKNLVFTHIQQGGSTITQQLARNLYLDQEKTYNRKLTELFYAYELEQKYSKDEILELYLNVIYFSNGIYGAQSAAEHYFQKTLNELSRSELAFIASIPNNPNKYDPIKHFEETKKRQERLLDSLVLAKKLSQEEAYSLKKEKIHLNLRKHENLYPDYAVYVEEELKQLISQQEGFSVRIEQAQSEEEKEWISELLSERVDQVIASGVVLHTNLDPAMQEKTIAAVKKHLPYNQVEGAAVVIDNATRQIIAMSGGKEYKKYYFHRAFQAFRQPGSSIKPLLVYGPYIERFDPSIYESVNSNTYCINGYCPTNYGNVQYGMVSLQTAFARSLNSPAIRLVEKVGLDEAFSYLNPFSFDRVEKKDKTYAAAIGGFTNGMSPLEMTRSYSSFIDGRYIEPHALEKVVDDQGNILYEWNTSEKELWSSGTVKKIRTLLHSSAVNGTGRPAYVSKPYVGIKTGTTNQYFDYWTVGLTNDFTTGVWVGHDIPKNMKTIENNRPSHLIWRDIMK
ncbi:transglycosylase domain-containing protein [Bacillus spongiae]|uniref:Transglycosylase domain-containing protein n=1 Tax=Bacillus spongiae TaxID=2683610 RepID=A0ABU8HEU9_9BACI